MKKIKVKRDDAVKVHDEQCQLERYQGLNTHSYYKR